MRKLLFIALLITATAAVVWSDGIGIRTTDKRTAQVSTNDAAGADTITLAPSVFEYIITPTITDSVTYAISSTARSKTGDKLVFLIKNSSGSGHKVKFPTRYFQTTGADSVMNLTSAKYGTIEFMFYNTVWIERSRILQ